MNIQLQVGVKAFLKNKDGKYLIVQRNPEKYKEAAHRWDIVGGRINPGMSLFENLQREIKEEVGLDLIEQPTLVAAQDILRVPGQHVVRLTYVGVIDGEPTLDTSENVAYQWATLDEIKSIENMDIYFKELLNKKVIA